MPEIYTATVQAYTLLTTNSISYIETVRKYRFEVLNTLIESTFFLPFFFFLVLFSSYFQYNIQNRDNKFIENRPIETGATYND